VRPACTAAVALVLVALSAPAGHAATPDATKTPISHLVVMTQDQHSFDNYFGARAGVDGIPQAVCVPATARSSTPCVMPFSLAGSGLKPTLLATATAQQASVDGGRMDGFVRAQTAPRVSGKVSMGYYPPTALPGLTELADHGVVFDRWFSSVPGGTIANRLFAVSATAVPDTEQVPATGWADLPVIFDRLQSAGVSWKIYVENYAPTLTANTSDLKARRGGQLARVPLLSLSRYENNPALMAHIADLDTYYSDVAAGTLPAVSWLVTTASTERAPSNPLVGQRQARNVVNALGESPEWPSSAFLLSYDSSGGWYDHVAPPTEDGVSLGLRVPALLISPYATPGAVDHSQLDSASVLRFIETNWSLAPLAARDRDAANLGDAFSFGHSPRAATILGTAKNGPAPLRPNRHVIYGVYLLAALAVAVVVGWAVVGGRRADRDVASVEPA
jgi:phospholipase C